MAWASNLAAWQCALTRWPMPALGLHTNAELIHFAIKHGLVER